jgi:uncharacterized membrane protein YedE/YeeE
LTTFDISLPAPQALTRQPVPPYSPVAVAVSVITLDAAYLQLAVSTRQAALFIVGAAAGVVLYHAAFGFTTAWRVFIADRRGAGIRAQMLLFAVTALVFFPAIGMGTLFDQAVRGSVAPLSLGLFIGAFMFGTGMQLAGGCASGTLYTVGGGSVRMVVTLTAFIAGSVLGAAHFPFWQKAPSLGPVSLIQTLGVPAALGLSLMVFAAIARVTVLAERRRHGGIAEGGLRLSPSPGQQRGRWMRGPWPLVAGALGLAAVNVATLWLAGRPWGVTSAFALWGSKALAAAGVPVASWPYWATRQNELNASVLSDVTSVMNFGIVAGALVATGLAGRFAPTWRIPLRSLVAAVVGGLCLGYGARIAYGCNIGAYFSGIVSASLHGWVWGAAAFAGSVLGTRLRPIFGLSVEGRHHREVSS